MRYLLLAIFAAGTMSSASAQTSVAASAVASESGSSATASTNPVADADQTVRCRTVRVTGSLVKKGKVCKTLAEWRQMADSGNDLARRLVEDGTSRPSGQ